MSREEVMKTYLFKTAATVKEADQDNYWVDRDFIGKVEVKAENLTDALADYVNIINKEYDVKVSKTAIDRKNAMFVDRLNGETVQIGYVITGGYDFELADGHKWVKKYIDLWVDVREVSIPNFSKIV